MKDKLIAVTTLGFIFSLFFYYKVISPADNATASSKIDKTDSVVHFVNQIEKVEKLNEITVPITDSFKSDENDNTNCKLDIDETNKLSFSVAFKYFRNCNGVDSNFNWNENIYSTLLKSEIESKVLLTKDKEVDEITNFPIADKKHLSLQNQLIGDNRK
jgi:hypothetical protein